MEQDGLNFSEHEEVDDFFKQHEETKEKLRLLNKFSVSKYAYSSTSIKQVDLPKKAFVPIIKEATSPNKNKDRLF